MFPMLSGLFIKSDNGWVVLAHKTISVPLKGTATQKISTFYKKELFKPWILIPVSSQSGKKVGSCGRLKKSKWPTFRRHFEYIISF